MSTRYLEVPDVFRQLTLRFRSLSEPGHFQLCLERAEARFHEHVVAAVARAAQGFEELPLGEQRILKSLGVIDYVSKIRQEQRTPRRPRATGEATS